MALLEYISRYKSSRTGSCRKKHLTKTIFDALVVSSLVILSLYLITIVVPIELVHATRVNPAKWNVTTLDGYPDSLLTDDRNRSIFLTINGDVFKYNENFTLLASTNETATAFNYKTSQQYANKLFKITKPGLLFSCWQNPNSSLICFFYRTNDLKATKLSWLIPQKNTSIFKTDLNEQLQVLYGSHDPNYLLIATSRPASSEAQLEQVIDFQNASQNSFGLPPIGLFRVNKDFASKSVSLELTAVLPYRKHLDNHILLYHYVYMFNYGAYTYFVMNDIRKQKSNDRFTVQESTNEIKVARICRNDSELRSYAEIPLTIQNPKGKDIYARVAYLAHSEAGDSNLYVITSRNDRRNPSARLTSYSMQLVDQLIDAAVSDCHEARLGSSMLRKSHLESERPPICQKSPTREWCTSATNPYIGGLNGVLPRVDAEFDLGNLYLPNFLYTEIQARWGPDSASKEVYYIGTKSGYLSKFTIDHDPVYTINLHNNSTQNYLLENQKVKSVFKESPSWIDLGAKYAVGNGNIFVTTNRNQIHVLPIEGCQYYHTCSTCLYAVNTVKCFWCAGSCLSSDKCSYGNTTLFECNPVIYSFSPVAAPESGGTKLTIFGENLGSRRGVTKVMVANQECFVEDWEKHTVGKIECVLKPSKETNSSITVYVEEDHQQFKSSSQTAFKYARVKLYGCSPAQIPRVGSSKLTIYGENLDVGSERKVLFREKNECKLLNVTSDQIHCILNLNETSAETFKFNEAFKVLIDESEQEFHTSPPTLNHLSSPTIELHDIIEQQVTSPIGYERDSSRPVNILLTLILIAISAGFIIYLTVYNGLSEIRKKMKPNSLGNKSDLEGANLNFRNANCKNFINSDTNNRPSESLSGLIKLNDLSGDYFSTSEQQDKPLIHHVVDEETMSILRQEKILLDRNRLTLGHVLGSGQFGRVYKGFLKMDDVGEHATVAVKTLHNRCHWDDSDNYQAFLEEGLMMKDFEHENVLALIGVTFDSNGLPMVITPFMLYGDLRSYISDEASSPTVKELIYFGIQVAKGMAYLSSLKFVHRDLAARNCMLDENLVVKVADFGLSRDIYESDYYSSDNKAAKLPVKWMAIESLERSVYSTKTDVWSYGVLLWELMTRGVVPYPDVDNFDLFSYLKEGRRMLRPRYCPVNLYKIMQACWAENPDDRPTFEELVVSVSNVITQLLEATDSGEQQEVSRETYCDLVS